LTKNIDIAVRREDLEKIALAAEPFGLEHRHVAAWICSSARWSPPPGEPST
jgi:hypothetical protein